MKNSPSFESRLSFLHQWMRGAHMAALAGYVFASLLSTTASVSGSYSQTATEIQFSADLDGDGRQDLVVLDSASGGFRAAYQTVEGVWSWGAPRSSGMAGITGAAVGNWFNANRDAFAVVAPAANRTHIIQAPSANALPNLFVAFAQSLGPIAVASPDIGGMGNTVHADLWLATVENGMPNPVRLNTQRHNGLTFNPLQNVVSARLPEAVRSVVIKDGGSVLVASINSIVNADGRFSAVSYATGSAVEVAFAMVPEGSSWTSGRVAAGSLHHLLTWIPGEFTFRSHAVNEGPPAVFSLAAAMVFPVTQPIGKLVIVSSDQGPRLIVISETGDSAQVYAFDGISAPVLLQNVALNPGKVITGMLPLPAGGFHLFEGQPGSGLTQSMVQHTPSGGVFVPGPTQELPALRPASLRANVFVFGSEPFVDPAAQLLARYSAPEWSSSPTIVGNELSVEREIFGDSTTGLGSKAPIAIGTVPMGAAFALGNQYTNALAVHSFDAGDGRVAIDVSVSPLPGIRTQGFYLKFSSTDATAQIFFRINGGAWTLWNNQQLMRYENTSVEYYARELLTQNPTPIKHAEYVFEKPPHEVDSDDDGVPDFVEIGIRHITDPMVILDPLGGTDSDGDGFSDLNELIIGTNPSLATSVPTLQQRLEENLAFRMRVAPRPIDGSNGARAMVALGNRLELFTLDGASLGGSAAEMTGQPGVIGPGHSSDKVVADPRLGLVVVMTEPIFPIATVNPDKDRGREIAGLFLIPEGERPFIDYTPSGGSLADETTAWLAAATIAYSSIQPALVSGNWNEIDTLTGLLLERRIEEIFLDRSLPGLTPGKLTLFGGRRGDAGRFSPTSDDLLSLNDQISPSMPGYSIREMYDNLSTGVLAAQGAALRSAATAIYRLSSQVANDSPPGTYLPPFDVLRSFVRGNPLPEPYLSEVNVTAIQLAAAQTYIASLLDAVPARPVQTLAVVVQEDSFTGLCHAVILLGTDHPVNLFSAPGQPYSPPIGFQLLPGTKLMVTGYTDIVSPCAGTSLELIEITVVEIPLPAPVDTDQNLLLDAWEWAFMFGGGNPFDDDDGDGVSNLQEMLDGTDPLDPNSKSMEVVNLSPPAVVIMSDENNGVDLWWSFPDQYSDAFAWTLETSPDLLLWTPHPEALVIETEPGVFTLELPGDLEGFYRIQMTLKP